MSEIEKEPDPKPYPSCGKCQGPNVHGELGCLYPDCQRGADDLRKAAEKPAEAGTL